MINMVHSKTGTGKMGTNEKLCKNGTNGKK